MSIDTMRTMERILDTFFCSGGQRMHSRQRVVKRRHRLDVLR